MRRRYGCPLALSLGVIQAELEKAGFEEKFPAAKSTGRLNTAPS
jgi:hypothetical protein